MLQTFIGGPIDGRSERAQSETTHPRFIFIPVVKAGESVLAVYAFDHQATERVYRLVKWIHGSAQESIEGWDVWDED